MVFLGSPACLGIALASNAPLISGLIAGIVGLDRLWISGSHTSVSGLLQADHIVFAQIEKLSYEALGRSFWRASFNCDGWLRALWPSSQV